MSYQNVLYGDLKYFTLNSKNRLDDGEINNYINEEFINKSFLNYIKDFNIGYYFLIYNENSIGVTFYITDKRTTDINIKNNLDNSFAQIQTHIDKDDEEFTIKWVSVSDEHRGKKYAQFLIFLALVYTNILHSEVNKAMLDDDSDNYANGIEDPIKRRRLQSKNIYCRLGFKYEDETGGPEMLGKVDKLIEKNEELFELKRKKSGSIEKNEELKRKKSGSKTKRKTKKKSKKNKTKRKFKRSSKKSKRKKLK